LSSGSAEEVRAAQLKAVRWENDMGEKTTVHKEKGD